MTLSSARAFAAALLLSGSAVPVFAGDTPTYSPPVREDYPRNVYWGDTHLHTNLSLDAYTFGVTLSPADAYRFARGETVIATHGQPARLARPLDFLVVADHAEGLGAMDALAAGDAGLLVDPQLRRWREWLKENTVQARLRTAEDGRANGWPAALNEPRIARATWDRVVEAAERYNDPGRFTAFIGFEWTATLAGDNLHRIVMFRDGGNKAGQVLPLPAGWESEPASGYVAESDPETLWSYMESYETHTGGKVLAIPHNGNLSNGLMYRVEAMDGKPIDLAYAKARARWEPVLEVTQIKGDGETHPFLSPDDEFANYETWDFGNFAGTPKTDGMLKYEYARSALRIGLEQDFKLGANPFKYGMIGSTDSHTALSTADDNNFYGKHSAGMEPNSARMTSPVGSAGELVIPGWQQAASGYAAVWARENTREAIFDAIRRKEVYGTTGPRILLRFFGGWDFEQADISVGDLAGAGYRKGVPMGGDITGGHGGAPRFLIAAMRDPMGANLDRVQVVKGWLDADGLSHEKVFDVVWSGNRVQGQDGKLPAVGDTVNQAEATYSNTIGASELKAFWQDPDFDPSSRAFYYVRVLEIPTPRWTSYDAHVFGVEEPEQARSTVNQERAYSSPIWYSPTQ